ncbi:GNAT family N-acetyltransferase [Actinophytocola oryzae]|uniref:Acetyltransferase (GNAT) family protein n=1 Tax=Actinophytocola oryzae TaxID=502181 RepID=A0A4R7UTW2_9PSEU|nr:GNAT family N-acetyltransferase [Actinophytocola oryzae]TDV36865.1 acetyltransferase (GNAT) family protein [Actinophytocola oryzae]
MEIVELTADTWPSLEKLFSANKTVGGCWCCWYLRPRAEADAGWGEGNRDFLHARVDEKAPLGLLAIEDGEPLGWVAVAPRPAYPRLATSRITRSDAGPETWSVTCFFVHRNARRRGLTRLLLDAAVDYARERGARAVEGHPVDTEGEKRASGDLYHGTLTTFLSSGFELLERRGTRRALVRREL